MASPGTSPTFATQSASCVVVRTAFSKSSDTSCVEKEGGVGVYYRQTGCSGGGKRDVRGVFNCIKEKKTNKAKAQDTRHNTSPPTARMSPVEDGREDRWL